MKAHRELVVREISLEALAGVPAQLRAAVLSGQVAAYLNGAMLELGATLNDVKAVAAFLSAAGTVAVGCQVTFVSGDNEVWEPAGTIVDPDDVALVLAVIANQTPNTQPFMFAVPVEDLLPITVEDFEALTMDPSTKQQVRCVRQRLTFHVKGASVLATNLGTSGTGVFSIAKTS